MAKIDYLSSVENIREYVAGEVIFEVGDEGRTMFSVREGEVNIFYNDHLLEHITQGGFFGEMALIDTTPRSAMAVAKSNCKVAVVDRDRFLYLVHQTPTFALQVMQVMADRLRQMNNMVDS